MASFLFLERQSSILTGHRAESASFGDRNGETRRILGLLAGAKESARKSLPRMRSGRRKGESFCGGCCCTPKPFKKARKLCARIRTYRDFDRKCRIGGNNKGRAICSLKRSKKLSRKLTRRGHFVHAVLACKCLKKKRPARRHSSLAGFRGLPKSGRIRLQRRNDGVF